LLRQKATYPLSGEEYKTIKLQMLNWANQFSIFLFLDSNSYPDQYGHYECLLAAGAMAVIENNAHGLSMLQDFHDKNKDWLFGHICYDHKNVLEPKLYSKHQVKHAWPDLFFFQPQVVCYINKDKTSLTIESLVVEPGDVFDAIAAASQTIDTHVPNLDFEQRIDKTVYLNTISKLREHIKDGDCYEINFCNEGFVENIKINPLSVFQKLNKLSPAPFAAYYRNGDRYMLCSSPERYLYKTADTVLSQPIKGTARRGGDEQEDEMIKTALQNSDKDRAENVMIVDLMRNDLARSCEIGSVTVDELFGIYSFPQVHQMISTISGKIKENVPFTDTIRFSFPMGSMTGAPKVKVMELIENYEHARRELFSGSVGYITPEGDFDFNVIIRSLFYNAANRYLSYQTGGAITYDSSPEQEWEEMRLKAWALERIFTE
jgi:para-aminobenzoate synthetase component 1